MAGLLIEYFVLDSELRSVRSREPLMKNFQRSHMEAIHLFHAQHTAIMQETTVRIIPKRLASKMHNDPMSAGFSGTPKLDSHTLRILRKLRATEAKASQTRRQLARRKAGPRVHESRSPSN